MVDRRAVSKKGSSGVSAAALVFSLMVFLVSVTSVASRLDEGGNMARNSMTTTTMESQPELQEKLQTEQQQQAIRTEAASWDSKTAHSVTTTSATADDHMRGLNELLTIIASDPDENGLEPAATTEAPLASSVPGTSAANDGNDDVEVNQTTIPSPASETTSESSSSGQTEHAESESEPSGHETTSESESSGHETETSESESSGNETETSESSHEEGHAEPEELEYEPGHAVLFAPFALTMGVVIFIFLTRFWAVLPYTAVMFLVGALMGLGVDLLPDHHDHVSVTTRMWTNIDAEVLLLVFLPGLIFKDSMGLNVHLFRVGAFQCFLFAFPMVLIGTLLTACVARFIFPYDWSWNLALTFGSILSATDPVAVAALLEEVGAPPRLKVHIAGEALLNDGSAIVFFTIFSLRYFYELGIEGFGEEIGWGRGFALFFQMSLGGVAIGIGFGFGILLILHTLDRRFSREENVVEVTATCAVAYLNYYVADVVCHTSGVIATVACGVTVKLLGRAMVNDAKLLDDFWVLLEHILNTVLFTLGGAVWGKVVASQDPFTAFTGTDWGYMIVLYILLHLIRGFLFTLFYPWTVRIGLKTNWKESVFHVYGGLRGAVGIALAIALDTSVSTNTGDDSQGAAQTNKAFGMIGGMAFMTLVINGTTAGSLLTKLGLADSTETRKKIVAAYQARFKQHMIIEFVSLMTQHRFRNVNFGLVKSHVPYLADITRTQLVEGIHRHKDTTSSDEYSPPYLQGVLPYLSDDPDECSVGQSSEELLNQLVAEAQKLERAKRIESRQKKRRKRRKSNIASLMAGEPLSAQEMRALFVSLLRASYEKMIDHGELVDREFMAVTLDQSLEFAADEIASGGMLADWKHVQLLDKSLNSCGLVNHIKTHPRMMKLLELILGNRSHGDVKYEIRRMKIERAMCFMAAHDDAQQFVEREFLNASSELSEAARIVLAESRDQWSQADQVLHSYKQEDVELVTSHKFCSILLNAGAHYISKLVGAGLLKDDEAEHWVKDIEEHLDNVVYCSQEDHPGELHIKLIAELERVPGDIDDGNVAESLRQSLKQIQEQFKNVESVQNLFKDLVEEDENEN